MPARVPPVPQNEDVTEAAWQQFFEQLRREANAPVFYSQATDPGTAGVPNGTWSVWKNTTSNQVRLWANNNGVMVSVQLV